jgi:hypothetical protein
VAEAGAKLDAAPRKRCRRAEGAAVPEEDLSAATAADISTRTGEIYVEAGDELTRDNSKLLAEPASGIRSGDRPRQCRPVHPQHAAVDKNARARSADRHLTA